MNVAEILNSVKELLSNLVRWLPAFAARHAIALIASAVVVLVVMTSWTWYRAWLTTDVLLLVGPKGGASFETARSITKEIEGKASLWGRNYRVQIESTEGYEDNRRRVSEDNAGTMIGFAHDGFGDSTNVRILLPLGRNYLHILCRRGFVRDCGIAGTETATPWRFLDALDPGRVPSPPVHSERNVSLREVVALLKPGRVFLGPLNSGTRQMAEMVLDHYGVPTGKLQANGVANWHEMRAALNNGSIDVAFYTGPMGAPIINSIASDKSCVLVGLDGDRDAILKEHRNLLADDFEANAYANGDFCPGKIATLVSRTVLICSRRMSERDAYFLGSTSFAALRDGMPDIEWETRPADTPNTVLYYPLHPGAQLLKDKRRPSWMPGNLSFLWLTVGLWLTAEVVQWFNSLFRRPAGSPAAEAAPDTVLYEQLKTELDGRIHELERAPLPLGKKVHAEWSRKVQALRNQILDNANKGKLSEKGAHVLLQGLRTELEHELLIRRPAAKMARP